MSISLPHILLTLFALILIMTGALLYFFRMAHRRGPLVMGNVSKNNPVFQRYQQMIENGRSWLEKQDSEQVSITSYDGLKLRGLYIPAPQPKACVVLFHGFRSSGVQDFGGILSFYHDNNCSLLIVDQRACGRSEGKYITFGIKERQDALYWAQYLDQRFHGTLPVVLHGLSLGGATVMMSADLPLPACVAGLISDCGFTSPYDIIAHCGKQWFKIPAFPMVNLLSLTAKLIAGFSYKDCSTLDTLSKSNLPLFLIHGGKDSFVPTYMTEKNASISKSCKGKFIAAEAGHATSYIIETKRYFKELQTYLCDILH